MFAKLLGAGMVAASTAYFGFYAAENEKKHLQDVKELERMLWQLRGEIAYTKAPAADVFTRTAPRLREPFRSWAVRAGQEAEKMQSTQFGEIWEDSTALCLKDARLSREELSEFASLGRQLGGASADMQEKLLKWHAEQLARRGEELQYQMKDRQKLYRCLGITAGMFLALLFL